MTTSRIYNWRKVWEFGPTERVRYTILEHSVQVTTIHLDELEATQEDRDAVLRCDVRLGISMVMPPRLDIPLWSLLKAPELRVPVEFHPGEALTVEIRGRLPIDIALHTMGVTTGGFG